MASPISINQIKSTTLSNLFFFELKNCMCPHKGENISSPRVENKVCTIPFQHIIKWGDGITDE
jgi:hypothetical protein